MNLSVQTSTMMLVPVSTSVNGPVDGPWYDRTSIASQTSSSSADPSSLPVDMLAQYAQREMRRYLQTSDADTRYGYELFRRALDMRDEVAWYALSECYCDLVKSWVKNHSKFPGSGEDADYFTNRAFERLWRNVALKPEMFAKFEDLASLLQYTKLCVHSAVVDDAPTVQQNTVTYPETINGQLAEQYKLDVDTHHVSTAQQDKCDCFAEERFKQVEQNEFWLLVEKFLLDEIERIVIIGFFIEGLKNREMLAMYPEHFQDAKQIGNKRTSILRRLSRNVEFKEILQDFFYDDRDRLGALMC